jgi:hypothetical protein
MKKSNIINYSIFFIVIFIIILVILIINKYKKDKYIINNYNKQEDNKQEDYTGCTTLLPEELFNIEGKLKAASQNKFVFKPELVTDPRTGKKIKKFKPLYIEFLTSPNRIQKTYDRTNTEIMNIDFRECLISRREDARNNISAEYKENGFVVLDPLEKEYLDYNRRDEDYGIKIKNAIKDIVLTRWKPYINMELIFVDGPSDPKRSDIRIDFHLDKGCNSRIGSNCKNVKYPERTMNFAWFDVNVVLHEFGHALGLIHEHQSPMEGEIPRDIWNRQGLYKFYEPDMISRGINPGDPTYRKEADKIIITNVFSKYTDRDVQGTSFDQYSIMLYTFPYYVFVGGLYGRYPRGIRKNTILSIKDVLYISKLYPLFDDENKPIPVNQGDIYSKYLGMYPWISF